MKSEATLKGLFYSGEKKPHMWWEELEKQCISAFVAYYKHEKRKVHLNEMKLCILLDKVNAEFLAHTKAGIGIALTIMPMTMSYVQDLSGFWNEVNRKFPPQLGSNHRARRTINEFGKGRGRGHFGKNNARTYGIQVQGERGGQTLGRSNFHRNCTDSSMITLTDGQMIEYHPLFNFPPNIFKKIKQQDIDLLTLERQEYKEVKSNITNTHTKIQ